MSLLILDDVTCMCSSSSLLGVLHIAYPPMIWVWRVFVGLNSSDIDSISDSSNSQTDGTVCMNPHNSVGTTVWLLIFVLSSNLEHNLITRRICMRNSCSIRSSIILVNYGLFLLVNAFPIGSVLNVEYHVSAKYKLTCELSGLQALRGSPLAPIT